MSSFTSDERAFLEPNNDIINTAIVVVGFVVFATILSQTFIAFSDGSNALEKYEQASMIARDIAHYPPIQGSGSAMISAHALDNITHPVADQVGHYMFFQRFSPNLDMYVEVRTDDGIHQWTISDGASPSVGRDVIAASLPVVIELGSNVRCVPGTITVKVVKNRWK